MQVSALIYTMGREAEHVFKSFTLAEGDDAKIDVTLAKFHEHFVPKRNIIHERARFHQWNQNQRDTVKSYEAYTNKLNIVILGHVGISKYGIGFSLESWNKMCLRSCS